MWRKLHAPFKQKKDLKQHIIHDADFLNALHTEVYFLLPLDPILLVLNVKRTHEILIFA